MEDILKYSGIASLIGYLLAIPAFNYFVDKLIQAKLDPMEDRIQKSIAEQKAQIDKEYLELRKSIDNKMDKLDMNVTSIGININSMVENFNKRISSNEIAITKIETKQIYGDAFNIRIEDNLVRIHQRLDDIYNKDGK